MFSAKRRFCYLLLISSVAFATVFATEPAVQFPDGALPPSAKNVQCVTEEGKTFLRFDGKESYFALSRPDGWKSFTITMWIRPLVLNGGTVFSTGGACRQNLWVAADGVQQLQTWDQGGVMTTKWAGRLKAGEWVHLALRYDDQNLIYTVHVNGERQLRQKFPKPLYALKDQLFFGALWGKGVPQNCFNGDMNRIRIYTSALSDEELVAQIRADEDRYPGVYRPETVQILPSVASTALSAEEQHSLAETIPVKLAEYQAQATDLKNAFDQLFTEDSLQKERVGKRFEIFENLARFVQDHHAGKTVEGYFYAKQGLLDMANLLEYFNEEKRLFPDFPVEGKNAVVLDLKDFGAVGDGETDDAPAFQRAFAEVEKLNGRPAILKIPAGSFLLKTPMSYSYEGFPDEKNLLSKPFTTGHLAIGHLKNFTLRGAGPDKTRLLFSDHAVPGVVLGCCQNCSIQDFSVRWQENPYSLGTILEVDAQQKTYVIKHHPGTMLPNDPRLTKKATWGSCTVFNDRHEFQKVGLIIYDQKAEDLGDGKFKIHMHKKYFGDRAQIGHTISIPNRNNWVGAVTLRHNLLCNVINVTVENSPSAGFRSNGRWTSYYKCRIAPVEGSYLTTNADGCISAVGTYASNCYFHGMADDGFNLSSQGFYLVDQTPENITLGYQECVFHKGDTVLAVNPENGQLIGMADIIDTSLFDGKKLHTTAVKAPFPAGVSCVSQGVTIDQARNRGSPFEGKYKEEIMPSMVFAPRAYGVGTVVYHCQIDNSSSSGIVIQAGPALIEKNLINNVSWHGIRISSLLMTHEGPAPYCTVLKENKIVTPGFGLVTECSVKSRRRAPSAGIHGLIFENNEIIGAKKDMELANLSDAVFRNNAISSKNDVPGITFLTSENVLLEGNTFNNKPLDQAELVFRNTDEKKILVRK